MSGPAKISTPAGAIVVADGVRAELKWNSSFANNWNGKFDTAQKTLDSEIVRGCSAYVPFRTGMLDKSGTLGTVVGSGEVRWTAPYAKAQYYRAKTGSNGQGQRGGYWFERWKNASGAATVARIKKAFGGA